MTRFAATMFLAVVVGGCGTQGPVAPGAPGPIAPSTVVPGRNEVGSISGYVFDSGFRLIPGARVEVVDGPQAGLSTTVDATGQFSLTGTFTEATRFRATKDGYVGATQAWSCSVGVCPGPSGARPWLAFYLAVLAPPVNISGDYTLTFIADSACADFPDELRTRSYEATIKLAPAPNSPANTRFELTVNGGSFVKDDSSWTYNYFPIGVAGDYLSFFLYGRHNPAIAERLAANTYLAFSGNAAASLGTATAPTITTTFDGWIEYCVMKSEMAGGYNCGTSNVTGDPIPGQAITRAHCDSQNHRLILTRR